MRYELEEQSFVSLQNVDRASRLDSGGSCFASTQEQRSQHVDGFEIAFASFVICHPTPLVAGQTSARSVDALPWSFHLPVRLVDEVTCALGWVASAIDSLLAMARTDDLRW